MSDSAVVNAAFEAARAGGVVDTFLSMPAPRGEGARSTTTSASSPSTPRRQSMEMPAEYMFKDVPHYEELSDPVAESSS